MRTAVAADEPRRTGGIVSTGTTVDTTGCAFIWPSDSTESLARSFVTVRWAEDWDSPEDRAQH